MYQGVLRVPGCRYEEWTILNAQQKAAKLEIRRRKERKAAKALRAAQSQGQLSEHACWSGLAGVPLILEQRASCAELGFVSASSGELAQEAKLETSSRAQSEQETLRSCSSHGRSVPVVI
eukprot:1584663-Rhodomonas_salina.1